MIMHAKISPIGHTRCIAPQVFGDGHDLMRNYQGKKYRLKGTLNNSITHLPYFASAFYASGKSGSERYPIFKTAAADKSGCSTRKRIGIPRFPGNDGILPGVKTARLIILK